MYPIAENVSLGNVAFEIYCDGLSKREKKEETKRKID